MTRSSSILAIVVFLLFWCSVILRYETFVFPNVTLVASVWLPLTTEDSSTIQNNNELDDDCIFRNSSLYRKVYVYPSPGEPEWQGSILSDESNRNPNFSRYPWDQIIAVIRNEAREQYHPHSMTAQFSTELIVHDVLRNSCLRTYDPDQAELFLVPYLPSVEFHAGVRGKPPSHATSPYAQAILNILDDSSDEGGDINKKYEKWEKQFGLTSEYWKRRGGADHLLIFSEPLQGLMHPKGKRGSFHFIHTQRQLDPPIVLSVEVSTNFVQKYPACARKNILLPYPVTDGNQFNGESDRIAEETLRNYSLIPEHNPASSALIQLKTAALPNELNVPAGRPFAYWLKAGIHGACVPLRQAMNRDYKHCSPSFLPLRQQPQPFWIAMRLATFCPCPGGDTASAKRMFDAILAGCIPVILSHDFVWPFSTEVLPKENEWRLDPNEFSLRWNASDYEHEHYNASTCHGYGLEERLQEISVEEISSLRRGMQRAARMFRYWEPSDELPFNVLHQGVQPNGGAVEALVKQLEERVAGRLWPACREELERLRREDALQNDPTEFIC